MKWLLIAQGNEDAKSLGSGLEKAIKGGEFDRLDVAVAYATLQGIKAIELALGGNFPASRWVIGLDDAISQPEAIEYLMTVPGATVRLASMSPARRFHPKLYCAWNSQRNDRCVSAIGSGNMTLNGLRKNGEAAVILSAETTNEAQQLCKQWEAMWSLGVDATQEAIDTYRETYRKVQKQRRKITDLGVAPPEPDPNAEVEEEPIYAGNPASARLAWLEAGSPSAGGRDLEFPKAMMPFFRLQKSPSHRKFLMSNEDTFTLTFTERTNNQMWRLLFTSSAINAAIGRVTMRPVAGGNRSDLAVVFRKATGAANFEVQMFKIGSPDYKQLMAQSKTVGGLFRTTGGPGGRHFGFY